MRKPIGRGYARISEGTVRRTSIMDGREEVEEHKSESPRFQEMQIAEAYHRLHDYDYTKTYIEERSAFKQPWRRRPILMQLLRESRPGDAIVVTSMNRLTREVWGVELMREIVENRRLDLYVLREYSLRKISIGDPMSAIIYQVQCSMAAQYSQILSEKQKEVHAILKKLGRSAGGAPPLGFRWVVRPDPATGRKDVKFLEPNPKYAPVILEIWMRRQQGYAFWQIGQYLNAMGLKRPCGSLWARPNGPGGPRAGRRDSQPMRKVCQAVEDAIARGETTFGGFPIPEVRPYHENPMPLVDGESAPPPLAVTTAFRWPPGLK